MKNSWLASAGVWLALVQSGTAGEAGRALLDEIMDKPGGWSQMCSPLEPTPFNVPVPMFSGSIIERYFDLGGKEAGRLQAARSEVVPEMVEALGQMDLTKPPKVTRGPSDPGEGGGTHAGFKVNWLNHLHLQIIRELNAVETLPDLLRLEAQLHQQLESAGNDASFALPPLDVDASLMPVKPGEQEERTGKWWASPELKRDREILHCRIVQRELLGTMTVLLRNESFAPAIAAFEPLRRETRDKRLTGAQDAVTAAETRLAEAQKKVVESPQDKVLRRKADLNRYEVEEAVRELQWLQQERPDAGFEAAYTPALRVEVRAMTENYLNSVPPEKRKGAAAMPKREKKE